MPLVQSAIMCYLSNKYRQIHPHYYLFSFSIFRGSIGGIQWNYKNMVEAQETVRKTQNVLCSCLSVLNPNYWFKWKLIVRKQIKVIVIRSEDQWHTFKTLTTRKQRTDENTMCRSVRATGYGKLGFAEERTHWNRRNVLKNNKTWQRDHMMM